MKIKPSKLLAIATAILLIIGFYVLYNNSFQTYVNTRFLSMLVFSIILFVFNLGNKKLHWVIIILLLVFEFFISNIINPNYLRPIIVSKGIINILCIILIYKNLNLKGSNPVTIIIFSIIGCLNLYLMNLLIIAVNLDAFDIQTKTLTLVKALTIVLSGISAANYNFTKFNAKSTYFLLFVLTMCFSDITAFTGFFLKIDVLYYVERFLTTIAIFCFLMYCISPDVNTNKDMYQLYEQE